MASVTILSCVLWKLFGSPGCSKKHADIYASCICDPS